MIAMRNLGIILGNPIWFLGKIREETIMNLGIIPTGCPGVARLYSLPVLSYFWIPMSIRAFIAAFFDILIS